MRPDEETVAVGVREETPFVALVDAIERPAVHEEHGAWTVEELAGPPHVASPGFVTIERVVTYHTW